MSAQAMGWVLSHSPCTGTDRLVLLSIANHADRDGARARPSVATIATEAGVHRATVLRSIERLEATGVLAVEHNRGRHRVNSYAVVMAEKTSQQCDVMDLPKTSQPTPGPRPKRSQHCYVFGPEKVAAEPGKGRISVEKTSQLCDTNQNLKSKPTTTPPTPPAPLPLPLPSPVSEVFAAWQTSTGKARARLDEKRRRLIAKTLEVYPLDDVLAAVRGWEFSPHHRGENQSGTVYNDLGLLLRDASHIERFRDLAIDGPRRTPPRLSRGQDAITRIFGPEGSHDGPRSITSHSAGDAGELASGNDR